MRKIRELKNINYAKILYYRNRDNIAYRIWYKLKSRASLKKLSVGKSLEYVNWNYVNEVNHATHPDGFVSSQKFDNRIIMTVSGYPFGNEKFENQYVFISGDGLNFDNVAGREPIVKYTNNGKSFYSDGEIIEDAGKVYLYYRYCDRDIDDGMVTVYRRETEDLKRWTNEKIILSGKGFKFASPAIVRQKDYYYIYYVEGDELQSCNSLCRIKSQDLMFENGSIEYLQIYDAPKDYMLWHVDIVNDEDLLRGLFVYCREFGGKDARLYYAESKDSGKSWIIHKEIRLDVDYSFVSKIYRSTMILVNEKWNLYVPICTKDNCWFIFRIKEFDFENYY